MITEVLEIAATDDSILDTFSFSYDNQVWTLLERLDSGKTFSALNQNETELAYFTTEQLSDVTWID